VRLLFVTPQPPWPPSQGTTLRNWQLLHAAAAEHEVDLLTFAAPDESVAPELSAVCRRVESVPQPPRPRTARVRDLILGYADMERRLWSPAFASKLDAMLNPGAYDVVQLEGFEVAGYLLDPAALRREAHDFSRRLPTIVFDDHNAEFLLQASAARIDSRLPRRWPRAAYSWVQARRIRRREALYTCAADHVLAVSPEDAAALEDIAPHVRPLVIGNGVDCAAMPLPSPAAVPTILFSGKLDYRPNVDACEWLVRAVLPDVLRHVPDARVVLAGRDPAPAVRRLASPHVEITGAVSEAEMARLRGAAWVYAVPIRMGSGVRFKVLEAMAAQIPLVSTTLGASGTRAEPDEHVLIANDAAAFAAAVVALLRDPVRRMALATRARALAEELHDWRHITPRLLELYRRIETPPGRSVSVIGTVLNEEASVGRLLSSLEHQTRPPDETILVDGGSTDATPAVIRSAPLATRVLEEPGANISRGRNAAIGRATHGIIAAVDAGVELHPAWLARLTKPLASSHDVSCVSGFFVSAPQSTWELALGATTLPDAGEIDPRRFLPSSRSVAFTRGAWETAGGYPEWLDFCEDLVFDLNVIRTSGQPRFAPRAVVRFRPRATPGAFFRQYYRYARGDGKANLWRKRHAIRYATYVAGSWLAWRAVRGSDHLAAALLVAGGAAYLKTPLIRLSQQAGDRTSFVRAAPLVPLVRLVGDIAKMLGYPVGLLWRLQHRSQIPSSQS
jgi:glycosyltransferase involved in cell wall biosynthesis